MEENAQPVEPVATPPTPPVKVAQLRHREIISRLVYYTQTVDQIATELGFSPQHINKIISSPLFQAELQKELTIKRRMERDAVLQQVADAGSKKLLEAVTTGKLTFINGEQITEKALDGREIIAIAHDALDRTGHKPTTTVIEGHVDLGSLIIQATKESEEAIQAETETEVIDVTPVQQTEGEVQ